ncbi:MAG: hypothetical protein Q7S57_02060 [bacterium]|nr:hypothetical protein [bacterium]
MFTNQKRFEIAQKHLQSVEALDARIDNRQLRAVVDFLQAHCRLIVPKLDGKFSGEQPFRKKFRGDHTTNKIVWVYVFDPDDLSVLPDNCISSLGLRDDKGLASYFHPNRFLVMRDLHNCSTFLSGMITAHEGFHALKHAEQNAPFADYDLHEFEAHDFEFEIMTEIGGSLYRAVLDQRVRQIEQELGGRSIAEVQKFSGFHYPPQLDEVWGSHSNPAETKTRKWQLHLHALFCLIKRLDVDKNEMARIATRCWD